MIHKLFLVGCALSMEIVTTSAQPVQQPAGDHKEVKVDAKIFDGFEGWYQMAPNLILNITRDGDHLYAQATNQGRFEIFPESEKDYFAKVTSLQITFKTGDGPKATELIVHQRGRDTTAKRIEGEPERMKARKSIALDSKILEAYVGRYQVTPAMSMAVTLENGRMFTQMSGQTKIEVFAESQRDFFVKQFDAQITFDTDPQGNVTDLILRQNGRKTTARRIVQATAGSLHSQLAEIDSMIAADLAKRPVGSVTAGVVSARQLIWSKSYGDADMEKKSPADQDTVYRIGSITKMFTALMLEQLVEAGNVHLSDPAEKYFPEIKTVQDRFPSAPPVTLMQLATHTAGLGREPDDADTYVKGPVANWEKTLIAALPHVHYQFEPGPRFFYSNIGFAILGAALSRAAAEPYVKYVPNHIFEPLGMTHSALEKNSKMALHLSKGYQLMGRGGEVDSGTAQREHEEGRGYKVPNGAIYTTVGDLASFASFLMGEGPESVLKAASLQRFQMQSAVPADIGLTRGYGLGFQVDRRDNYVAFGHGGAVAGYTASLLINRQKEIGVIVLLSGAANPGSLAERSLDILSK